MDYKEKLRLAKEAWDSGSYDRETIEYLFPELKESDDERIRKEIISAIKEDWPGHTDWIAWLEKQGEQKPAWSEEDEKCLIYAIHACETALEDYDNSQSYIDAIKWLKALKDRYTWKPSEKQMQQLGWIAEQNKDNMIGKELMTLYNDLKAL